jgi:primosomal protein N' (replication factor Y)
VRFDYGLGPRVTESLRASVVSQAVKVRRPAKARAQAPAPTLKVRVDVPDLDL